MSREITIGPYSAYAIAVKYGYKGTEQQWIAEQEASRLAAAQSAADARTAATRAENAQEAAEAAKGDALDAIGSAKTAAVTAVTDTKTKATKAVQEAQDTATKAVSAAQTDAVSAVEKAGSEVLESIPEDYQTTVKKVEELKTEKAEIDDTTVGADAWSSKHIVDVLCPPISETGNPVQCYPVAGYPLDCKVNWEPTQEGSGAQSPDNVRPIKGRDSVTVERCGKNLLNPAKYEATEKTINGITFTRLDTGEVVVNGTATGTAIYVLVNNFPYQFSLSTDRNWMIVSENIISAQGLVSGVTLIRPSDNTQLYIRVESGTFVKSTVVQPQIEKGTTAPTAYAPYTGQTATLTLPTTIYGGTVDAVTGEGQETWKLVTLDGTENYVEEAPKQYSISLKEVSYSGKCSHFKAITLDELRDHVVGAYMKYTGKVIFNTNFSSLDEFKHYLRAQFEAGTPIQICYTRIPNVHNPTFTATGVQPIPALSGVNTVLTDADSATVTGRADPIKRITDLEDAVASMTNT